MSGIDTISTTPDRSPYGKVKKNKKTSHTVLSALRSAQTQGRHYVFQVVRRRNPSSAEGTKGWKALMGNHSSLSLGVSPIYFLF